MAWPTRTQYSAAVQRPESSFTVGWLQSATFAPGLLGMPAAANGQTAMVFRAQVGKTDTAVRVFTASAARGAERYRALADHLRTTPVPSFASAAWLDDGIVVEQQGYPIVAMEWIEGDSLSRGIEARLGQTTRLLKLADTWTERVRELRAAGIAHGDLQHGNVLVDSADQMRFIDFDEVWVPSGAGLQPSEFGQPNYQHPDRTDVAIWGAHIDWFAALVIYVSIRALAADPSLWKHHNGDNLIFVDTDFRGPTAIWGELSASPDPEVVRLSDVLASSCDSDPLAASTLDDLLAGRVPSPPVSKQTRAQPPPSADWTSTAHEPPAGSTGDGAPRRRAAAQASDVHASWPGSQPRENEPAAAAHTSATSSSSQRPFDSWWDENQDMLGSMFGSAPQAPSQGPNSQPPNASPPKPPPGGPAGAPPIPPRQGRSSTGAGSGPPVPPRGSPSSSGAGTGPPVPPRGGGPPVPPRGSGPPVPPRAGAPSAPSAPPGSTSGPVPPRPVPKGRLAKNKRPRRRSGGPR